MAPHSSTLAWKIPWTEEPSGLPSMGSHRVGHDWSDFTFTFHFHALEKEMATHSGVLAWRIPGTGEPGGLPSMGSHRVGHDWSDLAVAAAALHRSTLKITKGIIFNGEISSKTRVPSKNTPREMPPLWNEEDKKAEQRTPRIALLGYTKTTTTYRAIISERPMTNIAED